MTKRIVVLHVRMTSAGGGGPEKTLLKSGALIDRSRFDFQVAYLRRADRDISRILEPALGAGLAYHEFPGRLFLDRKQLHALRRLIEAQGVDILHCHDPKSDMYGLLLRRMCPGLRLVATMHGWLWGTTLRRAITNRLDLRVLSRFDAKLAVSHAVRQIAERHGVPNVELVHNAIDPREWDPAVPGPRLDGLADPGECLIGYVGRLSREKAPLDFVRMAQRVADQDSRCRFVVAGEGPEAARVRAFAADRGMGARMSFLGSLPREAIVALYRTLDVMVLTSRTEGLPNTVLEALAMQVPVVATDVGGVGELVAHGRTGLLTRPGDCDGLARHVLAVSRDAALAAALKTAGRALIETTFSFHARMRKVEAVYERVVNQGAPS